MEWDGTEIIPTTVKNLSVYKTVSVESIPTWLRHIGACDFLHVISYTLLSSTNFKYIDLNFRFF